MSAFEHDQSFPCGLCGFPIYRGVRTHNISNHRQYRHAGFEVAVTSTATIADNTRGAMEMSMHLHDQNDEPVPEPAQTVTDLAAYDDGIPETIRPEVLEMHEFVSLPVDEYVRVQAIIANAVKVSAFLNQWWGHAGAQLPDIVMACDEMSASLDASSTARAIRRARHGAPDAPQSPQDASGATETPEMTSDTGPAEWTVYVDE